LIVDANSVMVAVVITSNTLVHIGTVNTVASIPVIASTRE